MIDRLACNLGHRHRVLHASWQRHLRLERGHIDVGLGLIRGVSIRVRRLERAFGNPCRMREHRCRGREEHSVGAQFRGRAAQANARSEVELVEVAGVFQDAVVEVERQRLLADQAADMRAEIARVDPARQAPAHRELQRLWHHYPVGAGGQHAGDLHAHAKRHRADRAGVGAMAIVVEIEHPRRNHAPFHGKHMAMPAAPHIEKAPHLPQPRRATVDRPVLRRARAAVKHFMVGDHHHLVRLGKAVDAQFVERALDAGHHVVVDHHHVRARKHDLAGAHPVHAAGARDDLFSAGHAGTPATHPALLAQGALSVALRMQIIRALRIHR